MTVSNKKSLGYGLFGSTGDDKVFNRIRPVRDFNTAPELLVYWDSLAAALPPDRDTTNRMKVSPPADTTYYATVEYKYYKDSLRTVTAKLPGSVKLWPEPEITVEDQSRDYCQNELADSLYITAMTKGPEPASYSWMQILGTDTTKNIGSDSTYTPSTSTPGTSVYAVIVSNGCGSDTVEVARISVFAAPTYTVSEQNASYCKDADATPLKVTITEEGTYTVTWKDNEGNTLKSETAGAGEYTYTPSTATVGDSVYSVFVSNGTCDAEAVVATVTVSNSAVVERDSIVFNSFVWKDGETYTKSQSFIEDTINCTTSRINFIVLQADDISDTICKGEDTVLVANVSLSPVEARPAVGDVLCLKPKTSNTYDTLILRPDTFLAHTDDHLVPIGVVFYVDPKDNRFTKSLALVDANSGNTCIWASDAAVEDQNGQNDGSHLNAAKDTSGLANTQNILSTAGNTHTALAAKSCYYYNPLNTATLSNQPLGWYLPSAGELCLYYAQRIPVNQTLQKLASASFVANIPFATYIQSDAYSEGKKGYWSSTDYSNSEANYVDQRGRIQHVDKTSGNNKKNVRAVFSYHSAEEYEAAPYNIGDVITFKDGSQGVICYMDPESPYKGWVAALKDVNNSRNKKDKGLIQIPNGPIAYGIDTASLEWNWSVNTEDGNLYARYNLTNWVYPASGMENTLKLYNATPSSTVTDTMQKYNYSVSNGWYIPDMLQLRLWYALFPIIEGTNGIELPDESWYEDKPTQCLYWSSTGTKSNDFGCLYFPDGDIESRSAKKSNQYRAYHLRPVRDFDFTPQVLVYWDSLAAANDTTDRMRVSPPADTTYYATVEYKYYKDSLRTVTAKLPGKVKVWPEPKITVEDLSQEYCLNEPAATLSITAMTEGPEPASYSWMQILGPDTNKNISSEATYTPSTSTLGESIYAVIVSNGCGSDTAVVARIGVYTTPEISVDVQSYNYCQHETVNPLSLNSITNASASLRYSWMQIVGSDTTKEIGSEATYTPSTSTPGTSVYAVIVNNGCGSDTAEVATVTVSSSAVVERDSIVLNSFVWDGKTYTKSQSFIENTSLVDGNCTSSQINFIVLQADDISDTICKGEDTVLVANVSLPPVEARPAVGDVLCLKPSTGGYDTLVLRPDTFLARHNAGESLVPMGVVYYVNPNDDRHGRAIALVDAHLVNNVSDSCKWSNNDAVKDGNDDNNTIIKAAYDTNGLLNTSRILSNARALGTGTTAPAAEYCFYYNHITQKTGTDSLGWYLPAAGELSLCYAQRVTINKTLKFLKDNLPDITIDGRKFKATLPLYNDTSDAGYWTSTDSMDNDYGRAQHINQKGQIRAHMKDGTGLKKYVRAVCIY